MQSEIDRIEAKLKKKFYEDESIQQLTKRYHIVLIITPKKK